MLHQELSAFAALVILVGLWSLCAVAWLFAVLVRDLLKINLDLENE